MGTAVKGAVDPTIRGQKRTNTTTRWSWAILFPSPDYDSLGRHLIRPSTRRSARCNIYALYRQQPAHETPIGRRRSWSRLKRTCIGLLCAKIVSRRAADLYSSFSFVCFWRGTVSTVQHYDSLVCFCVQRTSCYLYSFVIIVSAVIARAVRTVWYIHVLCVLYCLYIYGRVLLLRFVQYTCHQCLCEDWVRIMFFIQLISTLEWKSSQGYCNKSGVNARTVC